ncbi:MAG: acetate uptake transporter [Solirubrobacteraceae bacterium]
MATYPHTAAAVPGTPQAGAVNVGEVGPARFVSEPAALGLAAFGLTTMALSFVLSGILSAKIMPMVLALALAYGGIVQLLAGMWAFIKNDTFAAVALSSYGGFWISFYLLQHVFLTQIPPAYQKEAMALYLFVWGMFTFYMWIASTRVSLGVQAVFITLWPAYVLLGLGAALPSSLLTIIGGCFGLATAAAAWYVSASIVFEKTFMRNVLPTVDTHVHNGTGRS